ncbi:L-aminoadipate-semialdehyde dehydrogenase-phosphopantetheinyl transferase [Streptomyces sp. KO7888]|uniref:4'-phosphopantetheinyl transferase family protein n=1 Tax=Streptomyces sp. KO7888 TaxID=2602737 RepID=UPI0019F40203|nr:4'-phosphopantetheinyl transferase superfamily protein [Streptomyces sp. KO7888]NHI12116.1 L-aminoadipate-semialdehyde dehydrogenase-phosphopantetheinyl transferase [Streptomyces sp. KO7888]
MGHEEVSVVSVVGEGGGPVTDDIDARDAGGVLGTLRRLGDLGVVVTAHGRAVAPPVHVPRPDSSWLRLREDLLDRGVTVAYATWTEWFPAVLTTPRLRPLLGQDWNRYTATRDPAVRCRFAASRLLIKYTAAAALGIGPEDIDIAYQLGGRPYLRGLDQIEVALTHTGELMAVGISRVGRIGLDAECADRRFDLDLMRGRMCTPAEAAELSALARDEQAACVLRLWTLKEAYTKALGQGMRLAFTEFGFGLGAGGLRTPGGAAAAGEEWAFATHPVLGRYLVSTACHDAGLDPDGDTSVGTMLDRRLLTAMTPPGEQGPGGDQGPPGERGPVVDF